jgi:hypothetical protein
MANTTRTQRTVHQHLAGKLNLRPKLAPMSEANRERAKELPRLGAGTPQPSALMGTK